MANELIQIRCEDDFDDDFDSDEDVDFDCGQFVEGGTVYCQNAGTEMCDFKCPYRDEIGEDVDEEDDE